MMVNRVKEVSYPRKYGMISGISLLIMAIAAGFSYGFVYSSSLRQVMQAQPLTTLCRETLFKSRYFRMVNHCSL